MTAHDTLSFFTPDAFFCQRDSILSKTYNLAQVLLNRSRTGHVFVPIRSMQYLAVIEKDAFWFVDSMAYAVRNHQGGRLVRLSWHPLLGPGQRDDLSKPMDCHVIFYGKDTLNILQRLRGELFQSMQLLDQRYRDSHIPGGKISILPLK